MAIWDPILKPLGRQRALYYRQLATLLGAGVPITRSLETLTQNFPQSLLRRATRRMLDTVRSGKTLSEAMLATDLFPELEIALIRAGEKSGSIDKILLNLADYLESMSRLIRELVGKCLYPVGILACAVYVPAVVQFFVRGSITLFWLTFFGEIGVGVGIVLVLLGLRSLRQSEVAGCSFDYTVGRIPFIGSFYEKVALARWALALRALYSAGVGLRDAVVIAGEASGNRWFAARMRAAQSQIDEGRTLTEALTLAGCIPATAMSMISTGEEGGELDQMLGKVQEYTEEDLRNGGKRLATAAYLLILFGYIGVMVFLIFTMMSGYIGMMNEVMPR